MSTIRHRISTIPNTLFIWCFIPLVWDPQYQIANNNIVQDILATVYLNFVYKGSNCGVIQLMTANSLTLESIIFYSTTRQHWTPCYLHWSLVQLTFSVLGTPRGDTGNANVLSAETIEDENTEKGLSTSCCKFQYHES